MKKKIIFGVVFVILVVLIVFGVFKFVNRDNDTTNLKEVVVAEVAHSVFYAPQYLADSLGYFEDEGLDVEITLASGADAVMSAVLSGDVDIGFCGTEATIYVDTKKRKLFNIIKLSSRLRQYILYIYLFLYLCIDSPFFLQYLL